MADHFVVAPLAQNRIDVASALVRAAGVGAPEWRDFVTRVFENRPSPDHAGIVAVEAPANYLLGLFTHRVSQDLVSGRVLSIDHFILPRLIGDGSAAEALAGAIPDLAARHECASVHIHLSPDARRLLDLFRRQGFADSHRRLIKSV